MQADRCLCTSAEQLDDNETIITPTQKTIYASVDKEDDNGRAEVVLLIQMGSPRAVSKI